MNEANKPLQLAEHLRLRKELSTVQKSSIGHVWRNADADNKFGAVRNFLKARFGVGKLSSGEFVQFKLGRSGIGESEIESFAGKQAQQIFNKIYNDWSWYAVTKNKLLFETLMRGAKLPCPQTVAIFDRKGRGAGAPLLQSKEELSEFLANPDNHPIFCKPTTGLLSIGSFRIDGKVGEQLLVNDIHKYDLGEVQRYISGISKKGYLFQKVLQPHSKFLHVGCASIASVRMIVFNFDDHALLHSAVLKFPASGEVADNFWRDGSVIALLDNESGKVARAVVKNSAGVMVLDGKNNEMSKFSSFTLPQFEKARKTVLEAARFLTGIRVQSWDVAVTDKGPVLLEVNFGGDLNLYQLASGLGVMDKAYCDVLRAAGYSGQLPN